MALPSPNVDPPLMTRIVHYVCPLLIFFCLVFSYARTSWAKGAKDSQLVLPKNARNLVKQCLAIALLLSYVVESGTIIVRVFANDFDPERHATIFLLACTLEWLFIVSRGAKRSGIYTASAACTALAEATLIIYFTSTGLASAERAILFVAHAVRVTCAVALVAFAVVSAGLKDAELPCESEPLLGNASTAESNGAANGTANGTAHSSATPGYGAIDSSDDSDDDDDDEEYGKEMKERRRKRYQESSSWYAYISDYFIFLPMLVPRGDRKIQLCAVAVLLCLAVERALNLLVPRQIGIIANRLTDSWGQGPEHAPFKEVLVLGFMSWLQASGSLKMVQTVALAPVEQFSYRKVTQAAFRHVMGLSVDFHIDQNSGELIKALDQGRSLTELMQICLTEIGPELADIVIAMVYLYFVFGLGACVTIVLAAVGFFWVDSTSTNWVMPLRRKHTKKARDEYKTLHQAVQGWQNVSYFNRFEYEDARMTKAIVDRQKLGIQLRIRSGLVSMFRGTAIGLGFVSVLLLSVLRVSRGQTDVGSFVTLYSYWDTLVSPLNFAGSYHRWISGLLIDAERLLALFQTKPTIFDKDSAEDLHMTEARIQLHDVHFAYDPRKEIVKGIDLSIEAGSTVAFVGETGAGKSTILKLMYRMYDTSSGFISIDGQNIKDVTLSSLREGMGVVPQDPMLFNASIMENLRYARLEATDDEIHDACRAACIHDKIMTFPDKYQSKVGERGVRLSGGELQRVAIARVLLKRPQIVLLDEATSAIDTDTEQQVQQAITSLGRGRTTLVIAHRLSTIVKADMIVVMDDGCIIERGTHQQLLSQNGKYASLWSKQVAQL